MAQPSTPVRQKEAVSSINSRMNESTKSTNPAGFSPKVQQSAHRPLNPGHSQQFRQRPPPFPSPSRSPAHASQPQKSTWNFTSSFGPQRSPLKEITSTSQSQTVRQTKVQVGEYVENIHIQKSKIKLSVIISHYTCAQQEIRRPTAENSLRILTAVINGMRHWSQFKGRVSFLFEIFGQLFWVSMLSLMYILWNFYYI